MAKALGDVKVRRLGRQLLINIPKDVASALGLKLNSSFRIRERGEAKLVLELGEGPVRVVSGGGSVLRLSIDEYLAPFREGDRVLVKAEGNNMVLERIDYYIVRVTKKERSYYRINIPWELVEQTSLKDVDLVKVYRKGSTIVIERL